MAARTRRPISPAQAFWDTSALVPLCVHQTLTARARGLYGSYEIAVWWATPVEIASALARLARMRQIHDKGWTAARKIAANLAEQWWVVQPSAVVQEKAALLVESHDLRAADALQLAAALEWCENQPRGRVFLTADQRLREAAFAAGFDAEPL